MSPKFLCISLMSAFRQLPGRAPQPAPWCTIPSCSTHSPGALVVKKEDKEELLSSLGLFLLSQLQHIQRGDRDGNAIVQEALPGHLGIDDLEVKRRWHSAGSGQGEQGILPQD